MLVNFRLLGWPPFLLCHWSVQQIVWLALLLQIVSDALDLVGCLLQVDLVGMTRVEVSQNRLNPIVMRAQKEQVSQMTHQAHRLVQILKSASVPPWSHRSRRLVLVVRGDAGHLVDEKIDDLAQMLVLSRDLPFVGLVEIEETALLLEVVVVETVHREEVVGDEENHHEPLETPRRLHSEDYHEASQLHQEQWLQNGVIAQQSDGVVVFV